jgi:hypothetical protein
MRTRVCSRIAGLALAFASLLAPAAFAADAERPVHYGAFRPATDFESLEAAIAAEPYVYLPPGTYLVDNPLVIDRDTPLFVHGATRRGTRIVARDPQKPLLLLKRTPLLNLSNLTLSPTTASSRTGSRALVASNEMPITLEIHDCVVEGAALEISGPGRFRLQATSFIPQGAVRAPLLIDHPEALFSMVGGNISNGKRRARVNSSEIYHLWQKRGRVRIFGTGVQATLGRADFRIEGPSLQGPHVIANVRSEGNNGANRGTHRSTLAEVPQTAERVDLAIMVSAAAWGSLRDRDGRLVDYNAAGTLWLIGNNAALGARVLAEGQAPNSEVIAFGNIALGPDDLLPISAARKVAFGNLYFHRYAANSLVPPLARFSDTGAEVDPARAPRLPRFDVPEPIRRPRLDAPLPGMRSVREFGAVGDGVRDDTKSLQAALDADCGRQSGKVLYFPAGTYRVSDRLHFNHRLARCRKHPSGGWIAGAGSERSVVHRTGAAGGVFASQGLAQATIQGLTFRTAAYAPASPGSQREAAFSLENDPQVGHASQGVGFYDVIFDGGRQALGIGLESETNCSENLIVDGVFRNAHIGLAVGSYNALANIVYRGTFADNEIAMGHDEEALSGGTWTTLGARVRGTSRRDVALRNSASGVWYLHGLDSTSEVIVEQGVTGALFSLLFQSSRWSPPAGRPVRFDFRAGGGAVFLESIVPGMRPKLQSALAANFLIGIGDVNAAQALLSSRSGPYSRIWDGGDTTRGP